MTWTYDLSRDEARQKRRNSLVDAACHPPMGPMGPDVLAWFETIRELVLMVAKLEEDAKKASDKALPHGSSGYAGSGGFADRTRPLDRAAEIEEEADVLKAKIAPALDLATMALYGASGRGGVAEMRTHLDAACVLGYYLWGLTWPQVSHEFASHIDSRNLAKWCRSRAMTTISLIGRIGIGKLVDS